MRKPTRAASFALTGLFALFGALVLYAGWLPTPTAVSGPVDRARFMAREQAKVRAELVAPDSARFRNTNVSLMRPVPVLCGEVDATTASGVYAGFQRFISGPTVRLYERETGRVDMDRLWPALCGSDGPMREWAR